jgi:hypothetical protein
MISTSGLFSIGEATILNCIPALSDVRRFEFTLKAVVKDGRVFIRSTDVLRIFNRIAIVDFNCKDKVYLYIFVEVVSLLQRFAQTGFV